MTREQALQAIEEYIRNSLPVKAEYEAKAWLALTELQDQTQWHECNEDDPASFPDDDRSVLVSFSNFSAPMIARWWDDN